VGLESGKACPEVRVATGGMGCAQDVPVDQPTSWVGDARRGSGHGLLALRLKTNADPTSTTAMTARAIAVVPPPGSISPAIALALPICTVLEYPRPNGANPPFVAVVTA
jgi:hypothetical protein